MQYHVGCVLRTQYFPASDSWITTQTTILAVHSVGLPWPSPKPKTVLSSGISACSISTGSSASSSGQIKRLVLTKEGRTKLNPRPDREFYSLPRFVTHVNDGFIASLTDLYRQRIPPESDVLDLMSSWVSHLPPEVKHKRVVGHGFNVQELARNPRLDSFVVKDLNIEQELVFESGSFDAVLCAVSVHYLQWPEKVFAEVFRVLKPGGVFIVGFSNRMFYDKEMSAWRDGTDYSRVQLVVQYFQCVDGFTQPEVVKKFPQAAGGSPLDGFMRLLGLFSSDPFYAVLAYRNFKPMHDTT